MKLNLRKSRLTGSQVKVIGFLYKFNSLQMILSKVNPISSYVEFSGWNFKYIKLRTICGSTHGWHSTNLDEKCNKFFTMMACELHDHIVQAFVLEKSPLPLAKTDWMQSQVNPVNIAKPQVIFSKWKEDAVRVHFFHCWNSLYTWKCVVHQRVCVWRGVQVFTLPWINATVSL